MLAKPVPHEGSFPVTDWASAQERANFVLLVPKSGSACRIDEASLRGESKRHYSSLRMMVTTGPASVRLKQSFNDWWVPVANDLNLRRVDSSILLEEEAISLGTDYHRRPGACAQILGTTVEAYVTGGTLDESGWRDLFASLEPATPGAVPDARRTTFAERSYWGRWNRDVGPWDSHEFTKVRWMRPDHETFAQVAWASTPDRWAPMPGAPDSIASRAGEGEREIQVLFRQPMTLNHTSWLRIVDPAPKAAPIARLDPRYPQSWKRAKVRGHDVEFAALDPSVGAWFFAWKSEGRSLELHVRAKKGLDERRALGVLEAVIS